MDIEEFASIPRFWIDPEPSGKGAASPFHDGAVFLASAPGGSGREIYRAAPAAEDDRGLARALLLALRFARRRGLPRVMILTGALDFHPNLQGLLPALGLPRECGVLLFGAYHFERPAPVSQGITAVTECDFPFAFLIGSGAYAEMIRSLVPVVRGGGDLREVWADFQARRQCYATWTNLIWPSAAAAPELHETYQLFNRDGRQRAHLHAIHRPARHDEDSPCLGLLFLTRNDVNHPAVWRDFVAQAPGRTAVFSHPKVPAFLNGAFLAGTAVPARTATRWGDVSLVRAALLMLRQALAVPSLTHFALLSESCVPVRPLGEILRRLALDGRSQFSYQTFDEVSARRTATVAGAAAIPQGCWRFSQQWWLLSREHAGILAGTDATALFGGIPSVDEIYFPTLLKLLGHPLEGAVINAPVTWNWWNAGSGSPVEWHGDLPLEIVESIVSSGALFARKFPAANASIARLGLHRPFPAGFPEILTPCP